MPELTAIMDALGAQLEAELTTIDGLQVVPRIMWNPTPPAIDIYPAVPFQDEDAMGGSKEIFLLVRARVNTPDHDGAQEILLGMMDPASADSLEAAIRSDRTLGGVVQYAHVMPDSPSDFGAFVDPGGNALLGATWRIRVLP